MHYIALCLNFVCIVWPLHPLFWTFHPENAVCREAKTHYSMYSMR